MSSTKGLTVAVTGPTGTFGFGLIPVLEADDRIERIVGVARRPFDPAEHGWAKLTYRQGDVRDPGALATAFAGADVVVHLAFLIAGSAKDSTRRDINIGGTINAFEAAAAAGAKRFVYASSISAYGFDPDLPEGITEDRPLRPAEHMFYAQEKVELEHELQARAAAHPELDLYVLRPPAVFGPEMIGGKTAVGAKAMPYFVRLAQWLRGLPVHLPMIVPGLRMQVIHHDDVGTALRQCIVAAGPPGTYNIGADDVLEAGDIARILGFHPITISERRTRRAMRWLASLSGRRGVPETLALCEFASVPLIVDLTKAKEQLGWKAQWSGHDTMLTSFSSRR
jgi:nucleoside-diphosphate-sugar epimerase